MKIAEPCKIGNWKLHNSEDFFFILLFCHKNSHTWEQWFNCQMKKKHKELSKCAINLNMQRVDLTKNFQFCAQLKPNFMIFSYSGLNMPTLRTTWEAKKQLVDLLVQSGVPEECMVPQVFNFTGLFTLKSADFSYLFTFCFIYRTWPQTWYVGGSNCHGYLSQRLHAQGEWFHGKKKF